MCVYNILRRQGIEYMEELAEKSDDDFMSFRNLSMKGLTEIHEKLDEWRTKRGEYSI